MVSFFVADKMKIHLIVTLLIVNVVLANAQFVLHGYDYDDPEGGLKSSLNNPEKPIINYKLQDSAKRSAGKKKVHYLYHLHVAISSW